MKRKKRTMCRHQNGRLQEICPAVHIRHVDAGVLESEGINELDPISHYTYHCFDCKRWWRYKGLADIKQNWLRKIHVQLANDAEETRDV